MRMAGRRCLERFHDRGGLGVTALSHSPCGRWLAVADRSGMVNMYDRTHSETPTVPAKTIGTLVTAVSRVSWSSDARLVVVSSLEKADVRVCVCVLLCPHAFRCFSSLV